MHLLEQLEECPSSGDELVSPKKRIRYDSSLVDNTLSSTVQNSLLNCDSICDSSVVNHIFEFSASSHPNTTTTTSAASSTQHLYQPSLSAVAAAAHRKVEVRRLSESNQKLLRSTSNSLLAANNHLPPTSALSRRPSTEAVVVRERHSSIANPEHNLSHGYQPSVVCKRRRTGDSVSGGTVVVDPHSSRGRGHQLHSHHSHEASGGESADGSRPGTPLCDERPENLIPTEPRRIPRDLKPHEPMVLPLPKFAIQFYQQQRLLKQQQLHQDGHQHSSAALSNPPLSLLSHSSQLHGLNHHHHHSSTTSPNSVRSSSPRQSHHNQYSHHSGGGHYHYSHSVSKLSNAVEPFPPPSPVSSEQLTGTQAGVSPLRASSFSSNSSSDSEMGSVGASPSFDERIKSLDEMLEKLNPNHPLRSTSTVPGAAAISQSQLGIPPAVLTEPRIPIVEQPASRSATASTISPFSRHHFLDVKEVQPSDILKSVLAKKSIFDEDSKRLENIGDKYEPSDYANYTRLGVTASSVTSSTIISLSSSTSSASLPNLSTLTAASATTVGVKGPATPIASTLCRLNSNSVTTPLHSPQLTPNQISNSPILNPSTTNLSGTNVTPAKGLQYPFPSHPPAPVTQPPPMPPLPPLPAPQPTHVAPPTTNPSTPAGTLLAHKQMPITKSVSLQEAIVKPIPLPAKPLTKSLSVPSATTVNCNRKMSEEGDDEESGTKKGDLSKNTLMKPDKQKSILPKIKAEDTKMFKVIAPLTPGPISRDPKKASKDGLERRKSFPGNDDKDLDEKSKKNKHHEHKDTYEETHREPKKSEDSAVDVMRIREEELFEVKDEIKRVIRPVGDSSRGSSPIRQQNKRRLDVQDNIDLDDTKKSKMLNDQSKGKSRDNRSSHDSSFKSRHKSSSEKSHSKPSSTFTVTKSTSLSEEVKSETKSNSTDPSERIRSVSLDDVPKVNDLDRKKEHLTSVVDQNKVNHTKPVEVKYEPPNDDPNCYDRDFIERMEQQQNMQIRSSDEEHQIHIQKMKLKKEKKREKYRSQHSNMDHHDFDDEMRSRDEHKKVSGEHRSSSHRNDDGSIKSSSSSDNGRRLNKVPQRKSSSTYSTDTDDSDEPKKHSIFDIPEEGPYISMYDKVKARSCKNMQKQEEEKKIKANFSQLKQSRAKREEKKHSNSWDGDTDSDDDEEHEHSFSKARNNSSTDHTDFENDEEEMERRRMRSKHNSMGNTREASLFDSDTGTSDRMQYRLNKINELCDGDSSDASTVMSKSRKKITSRKNSRSTRIASDTSEDEHDKREKKLSPRHSVCKDIKPPTTKDFEDRHDSYKLKPGSQFEQETANSTPVKIKVEANIDSEKPPMLGVSSVYDESAKLAFEPIKIKSEPKEETKTAPMPLANLCDISSDEPDHSLLSPNHSRPISDSGRQKEQSDVYDSAEVRRKHKRKQKKQKSNPPSTPKSVTSDYTSETGDKEALYQKDTIDTDPKLTIRDSVDLFDELKKDVNLLEYKKKHSSRKDKKKEKVSKEEYENRENRISKEDKNKLKRSRKVSKSVEGSFDSHQTEFNSMKRGEKMEEIFGPLSDDDTNASFPGPTITKTDQLVLSSSSNILTTQPNPSDLVVNKLAKIVDGKKIAEKVIPVVKTEPSCAQELSEKERTKDDVRKQRKEKKRKEREKCRVESKDDDNSVDLDEAGRALEAQLMNDLDSKQESSVTTKIESVSTPSTGGVSYASHRDAADVFRFTDGDDSAENAMVCKEKDSKDDHRQKEKKKKKKRSKEEKLQRREHHQKSDQKVLPELKSAPSLPSLLEDSPPPSTDVSDFTKDSCSSKLSDVKRKQEKFLPGFKIDEDENLSESAVKSISVALNELPTAPVKPKAQLVDGEEDTDLDNDPDKNCDDKSSRAVISQEETEDAVAALLGESFASSSVTDYSDCYAPNPGYDEPSPPATDEPVIPEEEAEEMRKAVQSLHAVEMDVKPDTPQSETDLQIDTDTEQDDTDAKKVAKPEKAKEEKKPEESPNKVSEVPIKVLPKVQPPTQQSSVITKTVPEGQIKVTELVPGVVPVKPIIVENKQHQLQIPIKVPIHIQLPAKSDPKIATPPSPNAVVDNRLKVNIPTVNALVRPNIISPRPQTQYQSPPVVPQSVAKPMQLPQSPQQQSPMQFVQQPQKIIVQTAPRPIGPYGGQPPTINIPDQYVYQQINVMSSPRGTGPGDSRLASPRIMQQQFIKASSPHSPTTTPAIRGPRQSSQLSPAMPITMQQHQMMNQQMLQQRHLLSPTSQPSQMMIRTPSNVGSNQPPQSPQNQTVLRVMQGNPGQHPMSQGTNVQLSPRPIINTVVHPQTPIKQQLQQAPNTVIETMPVIGQNVPPHSHAGPTVQQYKPSTAILAPVQSATKPSTIIVSHQQMPPNPVLVKEKEESKSNVETVKTEVESIVKPLLVADDVKLEIVKQKPESVIKLTNMVEKTVDEVKPEVKLEQEKTNESNESVEHFEEDFDDTHSETTSTNTDPVVKRRGRGPGRGKKATNTEGQKVDDQNQSGVQTRRGGKAVPGRKSGRGSRGGGRGLASAANSATDRRGRNNNSESDVYEFHDDSGEEINALKVQPVELPPVQGRPRVILATKSNQELPAQVSIEGPIPVPVNPQKSASQPTSPTQLPNLQSPINSSSESTSSKIGEDFTTPLATLNTRKSRRLQEKDGTRTTVDDTIEDVVKNVPNSPKSAAGQTPPRRSTRSSSSGSNSGGQKGQQEDQLLVDLKKSPRSSRKPRKNSENSVDSGDDVVKMIVPPIRVEVESVEGKKEIIPQVMPQIGTDKNLKPQIADNRALIDPVTGEMTVHAGKEAVFNPTVSRGLNPPPSPQTILEVNRSNLSKPQGMLSMPASVVKTVIEASKPQPIVESIPVQYMTKTVVSKGTPIGGTSLPLPVISQNQPVITSTVNSLPITVPSPQLTVKTTHPLKAHVLNSQNMNKPMVIQQNHPQNSVQHLKINAELDEYKMPTQLISPTTVNRSNTMPPTSQQQQQQQHSSVQQSVLMKNQMLQLQQQQQVHGKQVINQNLVVNLPPPMNMGPGSALSPSGLKNPQMQPMSMQGIRQIPPQQQQQINLQQQQHLIIQNNKIVGHAGQPTIGYQTVLQGGQIMPGQSIQVNPQQPNMPMQQKQQMQINTQMQHLVKQSPMPQQMVSPGGQMVHQMKQQPGHLKIPQQQQQMNIIKQVPHGMSVQQQQHQQHMMQQSAQHQPPQMHHQTIVKGHAQGHQHQQQIQMSLGQQQSHILPPNKAAVMGLHQAPQILTGAVASPPLKQPHLSSQQPIVTGLFKEIRTILRNTFVTFFLVPGASSSRVSVPHISPQGPSRHIHQAGLPVSAFEANLVSFKSDWGMVMVY